ncbi:hypothetical protein BROUX41_003531 [Berkeleyomyces rouxiae]
MSHNNKIPAMYADSQQQPFNHNHQQQHNPQTSSQNLPMRPLTPMTSEAATTLSMINSGSRGLPQNSGKESPVKASGSAPTSTPKSQENDAKSPGGTSSSDHEDEGPKRKRSKKRPHKFYCTDYPPCTLSFTRSEHLSRHIRRHTGERPFTCHCNRSFTRLDNLRQHAQTVHANEPIPADSLAAQGGRGHRQSMARKRVSISQHPVHAVPAGMASAHSRSMSTPVDYGHPQYTNTFNTAPSSGPVGSVLAAPAELYQQRPPNGPHGQPMTSPWGSQPQSQPPHHPSQAQHPVQLHQRQQQQPPQQPQPHPHPSHGYGIPPGQHHPQHQERILAPMLQGNGHSHGHNRSRSLMTPAEISRPGPSHMRDNLDRLRRPSQAPNLAPPPTITQSQAPPPSFAPPVPRHCGHARGQSHGALSLAPGPGSALSNTGLPARSLTSAREWRLANQPQFNLQEELARVRIANNASGVTGNNANTNVANNGTNSQSPVTPTEDYYHQAHSPVASPTFSPHRNYARDRASVSSFDFGSSLHPRERPGQGSAPHGTFPPRTGPPAPFLGSLAPFARGGGGGHSRSQSWNAVVPERDEGPITLPRLMYDEREVRRNPLVNPVEPDVRM